MHKFKVMLCSAILSVGALAGASVASAEEQSGEAVQAPEPVQNNAAAGEERGAASGEETVAALSASANPYEIKSFFADFTHFSIGDTAPELYRSKKYEVTQWDVRHLPAPVAGSHWTYMGGNYVMIENDGGKILKAESGEIYYKH